MRLTPAATPGVGELALGPLPGVEQQPFVVPAEQVTVVVAGPGRHWLAVPSTTRSRPLIFGSSQTRCRHTPQSACRSTTRTPSVHGLARLEAAWIRLVACWWGSPRTEASRRLQTERGRGLRVGVRGAVESVRVGEPPAAVQVQQDQRADECCVHAPQRGEGLRVQQHATAVSPTRFSTPKATIERYPDSSAGPITATT